VVGGAAAATGRPGAGGVVAGLLAADVVLPVPSSVVSTAAGALFGWAPGAAVVWLGMTVGCGCAWALGRSVGRAGLRRWVGAAELARAEQITQRHGAAALAVSRPVPVLAEACGLPLARVLLVTGLANVGVAAAYAGVAALSARVDSFLLAFAGALLLLALAAMRAARGQDQGS
jgi:uncharacterized membrane protein YdjX (TVP38/TMEM64 family)